MINLEFRIQNEFVQNLLIYLSIFMNLKDPLFFRNKIEDLQIL